VGMGVLPLQFKKGENGDILGIKGDETFDIIGIDSLKAGGELHIIAKSDTGKEKTFDVIARLDAPVEMEFYRSGGILHTFIRNILSDR